jgi:hypothetical protein
MAEIVYVFLSIKTVGYHDIKAVRRKVSVSLRSEHGRNDMLSRKTRCCIFIPIIFSPFMIGSGCYFNSIARFRMKCKSNALAL